GGQRAVGDVGRRRRLLQAEDVVRRLDDRGEALLGIEILERVVRDRRVSASLVGEVLALDAGEQFRAEGGGRQRRGGCRAGGAFTDPLLDAFAGLVQQARRALLALADALGEVPRRALVALL